MQRRGSSKLALTHRLPRGKIGMVFNEIERTPLVSGIDEIDQVVNVGHEVSLCLPRLVAIIWQPVLLALAHCARRGHRCRC